MVAASPPQTDSWHLNKSVPVSIIFAMVFNTVTAVWFFADLSHSVANNRELNLKQDARIESLEAIVQNQAVTMGRMDENIKAIRSAVEILANRK